MSSSWLLVFKPVTMLELLCREVWQCFLMHFWLETKPSKNSPNLSFSGLPRIPVSCDQLIWLITVLGKQTPHHTILSMNKSVSRLKLKNWLPANGFHLIKMMFKLTTIDSTHLSDVQWIIITEFSGTVSASPNHKCNFRFSRLAIFHWRNRYILEVILNL